MGWLFAALLVLPAKALASADSLAVTVQPEALVLGSGEQATVDVRCDQTPCEVHAQSSSGVLSQTSDSGASRVHSFRFTPDAVRFPSVALLLFWVERPGRVGPPPVTAVRLPLFGTTVLEAETAPGAEVVVEVGPRRFGPVVASSNGKASVPIEVPPGVRSARVIADAEDKQTRREVRLNLPSASGLVAITAPTPWPAGETGWLEIFHASKFDPSKLELRVSGGRAERFESSSDRGVYRLLPDHPGGPMHVEVAIEGSTTQRTSADLPAIRRAGSELGGLPRRTPGFEIGALGGVLQASGPGLWLAVEIDRRLSFWEQRLALGIAIGFTRTHLTTNTLLGTLGSDVTRVPIELSVRARLLEADRVGLEARTGVGIVPFFHRTRPKSQPLFEERALGAEAFVALQGTARWGPVQPFLEVRFSASPLSTARLDAEGGGPSAGIGLRYALP